MRSRKYRVVVAAVVAAMALMVGAGAAQAAFPNFTGCTARAERGPEDGACVNVQQRSGNLRIGSFNVPLHETLEIRGTLVPNGTTTPLFRAPAGSTGFIGRAERVPGGLLGIEWIPGTSVLAITELAGSPSAIRLNLDDFSIRIPIKVRLVNTLLGMDCHIGTNSRPVSLTLIVGTTSPPAPNRPISGRLGTFGEIPGGIGLQGIGNVNVENSFAVPGATECGLGLGLINSLVNLKLGLPSAAGNNSAELRSDVAIGFVP
ncbi:MAG TPA: hypothetical protein VGO48_08265 [Conexibacter sp.]|nr:hypothetical protein [Conexibacter sp.]